MKKTKSLRLENSNKFIVLSLTILFPINIINILLASLLNVPIIGIFGLPLFFSGHIFIKISCILNFKFNFF